MKTQDLQNQINELTKQNDMILSQLVMMKQQMNQNQQGNQQNQNSSQNSNGDQDLSQLAGEFMNLRDTAVRLEQKVANYSSSQTQGQLTEKDVANLVLTLITGMVDWFADYLNNQGAGQQRSGQQRSNQQESNQQGLGQGNQMQ